MLVAANRFHLSKPTQEIDAGLYEVEKYISSAFIQLLKLLNQNKESVCQFIFGVLGFWGMVWFRIFYLECSGML